MTQPLEPNWFDDIDGTPAAETVYFSYEGEKYEIDLNLENAAALRAVLQKYIDAGREVVKMPASHGRAHPTGDHSHRHLGGAARRSANG